MVWRNRVAAHLQVSKAMRRLTAFSEFQEKHFDEYFDVPVLEGDACPLSLHPWSVELTPLVR